jgi:hypothetical protein
MLIAKNSFQIAIIFLCWADIVFWLRVNAENSTISQNSTSLISDNGQLPLVNRQLIIKNEMNNMLKHHRKRSCCCCCKYFLREIKLLGFLWYLLFINFRQTLLLLLLPLQVLVSYAYYLLLKISTAC